MASVGHPMVGDHMYGGRTFQKDDFVFARQALHAAEITFVHPVTLANMTIKAPFPADLAQLLAILRTGGV
jgi:23S rRNA pseudouridine1911/1915/1917 synthase